MPMRRRALWTALSLAVLVALVLPYNNCSRKNSVSKNRGSSPDGQEHALLASKAEETEASSSDAPNLDPNVAPEDILNDSEEEESTTENIAQVDGYAWSAAESISIATCGLVSKCMGVEEWKCLPEIRKSQGMVEKLGLSPKKFKTLDSVIRKEAKGVLQHDVTLAHQCEDSVTVLDCQSEGVQKLLKLEPQYIFSTISAVIPEGACQEVFGNGGNQ